VPFRLTTLAVAAVLILFSTSCGEHPENEPQKPINKLKVEYFWSTASNTYGYASIKAGVRAALEETEKEKAENSEAFRLLDYVQFEDREDPESQEKAEEIARRIRRDPDVLAIIGHAASGTTFAALPHYAEAGIPVLITSATSPYLLYRHRFELNTTSLSTSELGDSRAKFSNAFRLIPSDVPDQAHAMELTIKDRSKSRPVAKPKKKARVLLICDGTKGSGAQIYSKPICDYLAEPGNRKEGNFDVVGRTDIDKLEVSSILPEIHATHPDFIVVASYSSLARLVLQVWVEDKEKRSKAAESDPEFIMSDACLSSVLLKFDANIFVTYPMNPDHIRECTSRDRYLNGIDCQKQMQLNPSLTKCSDLRESNDQQLANTKAPDTFKNKQLEPGIPETDEMFGYDSVLILKQAVKECVAEQDLNRGCVTRYLTQHHDDLKGICETYRVEHGDRQNAYYYVYKNSHDRVEEKSKWQVIGFAKEDDHELNRAASPTGR